MPWLRLTQLCAFLLGGCVIPPPLPPAGVQYDGVYIGQDTLISGVAFQCGLSTPVERVEVRDGRFDYPFQVSPPRIAPLHVQIAADGTMAGQMQYGTGEEISEFSRDRVDWVYLRGAITGSTMEATITNLRCVRQLVAQLS
jgi:hypothetical protein